MQSRPTKKVLSVFSLVMINVIAVDSLRTLPISAEYGFSLVFYYLAGAVLFFIPVAMVAAELATGWPNTGGLYVWIREAFGKRWAFFTIWLQWVYNIVWYPTILAFMASALAYLIDPELANNKTYLLIAVLVMFWCATWINCMGMRASSLLSTIGAALGTLLPMAFIITLGIIWCATGRPEQIQFTVSNFWPDLSQLNNLVFFTGVLFGLIGMEMSAVHAEEVANPQRDYPRALAYSTIIIIASLILASLAIAVVVPKSELSLVSGLIDAFAIFFTAYHMGWMIPIIVMLIILGGVSGVSAWIIGPTKALMVASQDGSLPQFLQKTNRLGAPVNLLLVQGVLFTLLSSVFVLLPSINSSYWLLSALTAQLALIVYIMMFAAGIVLRYKRPNVKRSFNVPGGKIGMWILGTVGCITCVFAIMIGFLPPKEFPVGSVFIYESFLIIGVISLSVIPFIINALNRRNGG